MKSAHRRDGSNLSGPLPAISEDGADYNFPQPPTTTHAYIPSAAPVSFTDHSRDGHVNSAFSDTSSINRASVDKEKAFGLRNKKSIAKRGGWKRVAIIALIVTLCIVGLIVGLVVGLRTRNTNSSSQPWSQTSNSTLNSTFPAGSYSITTVLADISRNCTSNPATWRCYPYTTYSQSTTQSSARFDWLIRAFTSTSTTNPIYTVSSTANPFTLAVYNQTLSLLDSGLSTERYAFNFTMNKGVIPSSAVTADNVAATCYFNQTIFEGSLYTRMHSTYSNTTAAPYTAWPYAVGISQVSESGSSSPQCYNSTGSLVASFGVSAGRECRCDYMNYGT